jgi:hypothetical protein
MTAPQTSRYRGYDLVLRRQWSSWCVGVYPTQAELPILPRSALSTLAPRKADAIAEAKYAIDRVLSHRVQRRVGHGHSPDVAKVFGC